MESSFKPQRSLETQDQPPVVTKTSPNDRQEPEKREPGFLREIIQFSLIALLVVLPVRFFVAQPFIVSGASMETTFSTGEYLIVDQLSYHFEDPSRGDVIIFRYPQQPSKFFIKRVIGVPGDTIDIDGNVVTLSNADNPSGVILNESPYVFKMSPNTKLEETLGDNEYFVMGDNRDASSDSRMWGVLQRDKIIGRAFFRLFPFTKVDFLPGEYDINSELTESI